MGGSSGATSSTEEVGELERSKPREVEGEAENEGVHI